MDPQAALEGARMAADRLAQLLDIDEDDQPEQDDFHWADEVCREADNLVTQFRALDSWLSQGGFLPENWKEGAHD